MKKGHIFVVSGPSGAGKGSIIKKAQETGNFWLSLSATTREKRATETDGVDYYFLSKEKFQQMIDEDGFIEWASVHKNYYGTPKAPLEKAIQEGKDVIFEIDIQGGLQVKKLYPEAKLIFVMTPSFKDLKDRIIGRSSETEETLKTRLETAIGEIDYMKYYDYLLINDVLDDAARKLLEIIEVENLRLHSEQIEYFEEQKKGFLFD
ncbi:guanylate kinase [Guggenheimella bovis]